MSLRQESLRAYRSLYRSAREAAYHTDIVNKEGFMAYISDRFRQECQANNRRLSSILRAYPSQGNMPSRQSKARELRQYASFVSHCIDMTRQWAEKLKCAPENNQLTSILQVLGAGVGNQAYKQYIESNYLDLVQHEELKSKRQERTEEETSERQNRILQHALMPYGEKLLLAHRGALTPTTIVTGNLTPLSSWQMKEAIVGIRAGVSVHHLKLGYDEAVIEIDETFNKQTIFIVSRQATSSSSEQGEMNISEGLSFTTDGFDWEDTIERVEIAASEEISRTIFVNAYLSRAVRLCDALEKESPLHRSRKTVVVGHGVGGAVGLIAALLLLHRNFDITNTISFGAPKALQGTLERFVSAINPIRVVLAGDPIVDLPVSGAEGMPFVHVGEVLVMSPHRTSNNLKSEKPAEDSFSSLLSVETEECEEGNAPGSKKRHLMKQAYRSNFLVEHYVHSLSNGEIYLSYADGDNIWDDGDYIAMKQKGNL